MSEKRAAALSRFLNVVQHQAGWFLCVLGAAYGYPWHGALFALLIHVAHMYGSSEPKAELRLALSLAALGTAVDSLNLSFSVLGFSSGLYASFAAPLWITVLWFGFATVLPHAVSWLKTRYLLASALGAVGGPLSFMAGQKLGALTFPLGTKSSLMAIAAIWALVMPLIVAMADRLVPAARRGPYRFLGNQGKKALVCRAYSS